MQQRRELNCNPTTKLPPLMLRSSRLFVTLVAGATLSACSASDHGPFEPLPGGTTVPVTLETLGSPASGGRSMVTVTR